MSFNGLQPLTKKILILMLVLERRPTFKSPAARGSQITCTMPDGREIVITLLPRHRIGIDAPRDVLVVRDGAVKQD